MRALVLNEALQLELVERERPTINLQTDVLVRVYQTGVCGTDRSVLVGKFPAAAGVIMGHEAVGIVAEIGVDVTGLAVGDRVVVNPTLYCGRCDPCRSGRMNFCRNKKGEEVGIDRDGSYAEYMVLEDRFLHHIPDDVGYDRAVVTEPLACVLNNLDAAQITPADAVTVIGGGPIGVLCAMTARYLGSPVTVVERDSYRRKQAHDLLHGTFPDEIAVVTLDEVDAISPAPAVIDTVGNQVELAVDLTATAGTAVVMGYDSWAKYTIRPLSILQRGIRIVGAGDFNGPHFPRAVELASRLPLERLVTHHFSLEQHEKAFATLATDPETGYSALKVVIRSMSETS
jgi:threonine dehydrogenase-like Zn-dependent dehydrogenase